MSQTVHDDLANMRAQCLWRFDEAIKEQKRSAALETGGKGVHAKAAGLLGEEIAMWATALGRGDPGVETRIENFGQRYNPLNWVTGRMDPHTRAIWREVLEDMDDLFEEMRTR